MGRVYKLDLSLCSSSNSNVVSHDFMTEPLLWRDQPLLIVYNGHVCICDLTELQAKTIIWLANREIEARMTMQRPSTATFYLQTQLHDLRGGPSMMRSLQTFLQSRKKRAKTTSQSKL
ncbi:hypothetical protein Ancab_030008 [Ancistrocladus abbreviatus]